MFRAAFPLVAAEVASNHASIAYSPEELPALAETLSKYPGDKYWAPLALGHDLSRRYSIGWYDPAFQHDELTNTHGHDGADVYIYAFGPGASLFAGHMENSDIPGKIAKVLGAAAPGRVLVPAVQQQTPALLGALGE